MLGGENLKHKIIIEDIPDKTYEKLTIAEMYEKFEQDLKDRGLKKVTISFYKNTLEAFYHYKSYKDPVSTITKATISGYIKFCQDKGNKQNTISTYVRGLKTFLYFCMREGYLPEFKIKTPTPDLTPKTTYTLKEVKRLLVKPNLKTCLFSEYIAYVAINIFVYTGCRVATAIEIKRNDVDLDNDLIYLRHEKNSKPHCVPLADELKQVLKSHFKLLDAQEIKTEYVLISAYGEQLNRHRLYMYICRYNKSRNVDKTNIQAFRRFYIKSLVVQGVPIPKIMYLVQHSRPGLISLYTKLYSTDLIEDVKKFSNNISGKKDRINLRRK